MTAALMLLGGLAMASTVDATSVVDATGPAGSVTLAPGGSENIEITFTVTGNQAAENSFSVYRDWTLSGGTFVGSNKQTFTVPARAGGDPATVFETTGKVSVAQGQASGGPFTLTVSPIDVVQASGSGGKLEAGASATYRVTVANVDSTPPVVTPTITGTQGSNGWYTSNVSVSWAVSDAQSAVTIMSGCATTSSPDSFTSESAVGHISSCTARSAGGQTVESVTVKIDKTAPTGVTLTPSGTSGSNGWFTSDVGVTTSGADTVSGATCTAVQTLTAETSGTTVNGSCTNDAGLTSNASPLTVKIDKTGPSASLAVTNGTAGTNGWYTSDVTVTASGSDSVSGTPTCTAPVTLSTDTAGTEVNGSCTNAAGLTTSASPLTVKLDKSNPTTNLSVHSGTLGAGGWYTSDVVVRTNGADNVSEPVSCDSDQTFTEESAGFTAQGTCTNHAGRQSTGTLGLKIDKSAPTSVALSVVSGTAGANGWYTSDVVVRTTGTDALSGVSCTEERTLSAETDGTVVNGSCTNGAGLTTHATSITIKIDKTAPTDVVLTPTGTLGENGWFTSNVSVQTTGTDSISGVTCSAVQNVATETTGTNINGSCTNGAGLTTNASTLTVKLDKTAPSLSLTGTGVVADGGQYYFGAVPGSPGCTASDAISGVSTPPCSIDGYSRAVGTHTIQTSATNGAGLRSTSELTYTVLAWDFAGFHSPVDMDGVTNTVKGGSTVPLKFELFAGVTELTDASSATVLGVYAQGPVTCAVGAQLDDVPAASTNTTGLRYDTVAGQYVFNWKTPSTKDKCYWVGIKTADGQTSPLALFKTK